MKLRHLLPLLSLLLLLNDSLGAVPAGVVDSSASQMPSVLREPEQARASEHFDAQRATDAYLDEIPASAKARSDAYFEGGYWLVLWDFLAAVLVYWILLRFGWSRAMRNRAERLTRFKPLSTFLYFVQFVVLTAALTFPLAAYENYFRERQYGLATQTFLPWFGDFSKMLAVNAVLGGIAAVILFGVVRRFPKTWWIWGAVAGSLLMILAVMILPVFVLPMFYKVERLNDPKITQPLLEMARANGIPVKDVYQINASRDTTRMSANVSGFGKTMRITLNDNLLRRGSPEEIQAVMGHEMGHYVLNHIPKDMLFFFVVIATGFGYLFWALDRALARWGGGWGIRDAGDPAVLPLVFLLASVFFFVLTPILNTHIRTNEREADLYGLNASRQPDGFAQAAIHLGEYRKMDPGAFEEWFFFDHPSGRNRIFAAMRWKAENLKLFGAGK
jgi:STE24 endopeptidase